jgi:chromosome condensin MukBEF ATPase and DNA-binding subunit MukB
MAREKARVSKEEVVAAGRLKAVTKRRGLSLGFVLDLCQEIPDDQDARKRLAEGIQRHGSLWADNAALESRREEGEKKLAQVEGQVQERQEALSRLRKEEAHEAEVHRFYQRFHRVGPLIEYVASWNGVAFRRCLSCGARFWVERESKPRMFQKAKDTCPCCGWALVDFDAEAHAKVGVPPFPGIMGKINLGE